MDDEKSKNVNDFLKSILTLLFTLTIFVATYYVASLKTTDATSVGIMGGIIIMLGTHFISSWK